MAQDLNLEKSPCCGVENGTGQATGAVGASLALVCLGGRAKDAPALSAELLVGPGSHPLELGEASSAWGSSHLSSCTFSVSLPSSRPPPDVLMLSFVRAQPWARLSFRTRLCRACPWLHLGPTCQ